MAPFVEEFEKHIYEPWRFEYVALQAILRDLDYRLKQDSPWNEQDEKAFEATLWLEAEKIDLFIQRMQRELENRIAYSERILLQGRSQFTTATNERVYTSMENALTELLIDLDELSRFTLLNFKAIGIIIEEHDRLTNINRHQLFVDIARSKSLDRQRFDVDLVRLSILLDLCRQRGQPHAGQADAGAKQTAFERATAKYWVHPDNVAEVKSVLLFHLPILVFNPNKAIEATDSAISSVYLDNANFSLYHGRLERDEGAEAIRLRWYGPMDAQTIFVERKTHHAAWLDGRSVKDRFPLPESKINDFLHLRYTADDYARDLEVQGDVDEETIKMRHFIASGIQRSIQEKGLAPVLRVFYNRTAFQRPGDQSVRVSLDTDLTFIPERTDENHWRRPDVGIDYPFNNIPQDQVYRFPHAVLETKLQNNEPPEWLTQLLESGLVYEVPRFSKYLHGAASFWTQQLPLLPWWLNELNLDIRNAKQPTGNVAKELLSRSRSLKPVIGGKVRSGYLESKLEQPAPPRRDSSASVLQRAPSLQRERAPLKPTLPPPPPPPPSQQQQQQQEQKIPQQLEPPQQILTRRSESVHSRQKQSLERQRTFFDPVAIAVEDDTNGQDEEGEEDGEKKKKKKKKNKNDPRLEPKVFFANERTFIHWLQFSALILMGALLLLNFGDRFSMIAGAVFFAISLILALYAFGRFRYRAHQISTRPNLRYDDIYGPIGLCVLFVGALVVSK